MKKLLFLFSALLFLTGVEANSCTASYDCAGGSSISCTGDTECNSGKGWVECTYSDGGRGFNTCPEM
jgi:hypothetical protein